MKDSEIEYIKGFNIFGDYSHYYEDMLIVIAENKLLYMIDYVNHKYYDYNVVNLHNLDSFIYHNKTLYCKQIDNNSLINLSIIVKLTLKGQQIIYLPINFIYNTTNIEKIIIIENYEIFYICGYKIITSNNKIIKMIRDDYFINNLLAIARSANDIEFLYSE